jgi:hypothetical protein
LPVDAERFARQIALPEIGPDGQARIGAARVAVIGSDVAAATAATYLRAAGVGEVDERAGLGPLDGLQLVVRSGFDDDALLPAARRLGLPVVVMRASGDVVDVLSFPRRDADAAPATNSVGIPFRAAAPPDDGAAGVLAGTIAAAEALHALLAEPGPGSTMVKHLRLPLDGREPLRQEIPAR